MSAALDWASTIGTVSAAFMAAWGLRQARVGAKRNAEMIVRERRLDFELGILTELTHHVVARDVHVINRAADVRTRLGLLPAEELPLTRAHFHADPSDAGVEQYRQFKEQHRTMSSTDLDGEIKPHLEAEIRAAVRRRLAERDPA